MKTSSKAGWLLLPKKSELPKIWGGGCSPPRPPGPYAYAQEWAKELFEAQGNTIYKDISRKPKAPQDLICMASVLGKLKTSSRYFTRWKSCIGHLCYTVENSEVFTCKEIFLMLLSTVVSKYNFFCAGCYFKNQRFTELQGQVFTKGNAQELTKEQL